MSQSSVFSCYLIGGDSLLIECGEILLAKAHRVLGVISDNPRLSQWAASHSIACYPVATNYREALAQTPFDYLFSIAHLALIKDDLLSLPQKMAINFHDGPLPAYAGLNTPTWALLNGESEYGISWHQMVSEVDQGALLKQVLFEVAEDETSLSINTKCFAAALESFPVLVDELAEALDGQALQLQPQELSRRAYFGKYQRPPAAGFLNWNDAAVDLARSINALDFGHYLNPLNTPKVSIKGHVFTVTRAVANNQPVSQAPGSVLALTADAIAVATGSGVLAIGALAQLSGAAVALSDVAVSVGECFDCLSDEQMARSTAINQQLCRQDAYWGQRLASLDPVALPYINKAPETLAGRDSSDPAVLSLTLPADFITANDKTPAALSVAAAFALLLSRLGQQSAFDLALSTDALRADADSVAGLFSDRVAAPLRVDMQLTAAAALAQLVAQLQQALHRCSWCCDILARYPALRERVELYDGTALPVAIAFVEAPLLMPGTAVTLAIAASAEAVICYDPQRISTAAANRLAGQFMRWLTSILRQPQTACSALELLAAQERHRLLHTWNNTAIAHEGGSCLHQLFEARVRSQPDATALVFEDRTLSYTQLNQRANHLAQILRARGVQADERVGVHVQRSFDMLIATLAVWKAGAAYVPLDPAFPSERIHYMVADAGMSLVISQTVISAQLPASAAEVICVDEVVAPSASVDNIATAVAPHHLAYMIYTSGSTGKPKGVMVEHRNVVNFFRGMDDCIDHNPPGTWLAVTSLSFDISVLELFWTLTRGFKVVIYREDRDGQAQAAARRLARKPMQFGLFMWGNDDAPGSAKYRLMLDGARYVDDNGFDSVWTPERHFHAFGGPYPNPAVTSAALAAITKNVSIRSGSIVSPLHHAIRIAEDWAVVDNLSDGRVGLSFAAGWQPNDFVIKPEHHQNNKAVMLEQIDTVKKLWRGEKVAFDNPMGDAVDIVTLPRPVQKELPVWLTTAGNPESYRQAGLRGFHVLTHLLGQSLEELAEKIRSYRQARREAGLDPNTGQVTLMLHTFVGESDAQVREWVREPMKDYLRSSMKLVLDFAWSFPAFKRPGGDDAKPDDIDIKSLTPEEMDTILDFAFERYYETSGLFGTVDTCVQMVDRCKAAGVDEIACLLDFGVATERVMAALPLLTALKDRANSDVGADAVDALDQSLSAQLARHQVTHFQCTPSMARILCVDDAAHRPLANLQHMMVGGEALPVSLATELNALLQGRLSNMYGPTETTIWSTTQDVSKDTVVPIGRPIANTQIYLLDAHYQPVPVGVPGELFIGGEGVVRGYFNRPELTAARFIASPFSDDPRARLYRTGDLARYREDGVIEFLGRVDHQVKIRGYRVELGEIEAVLESHRAVEVCSVLLREQTPGDQRLVAYIVLAIEVSIATLKDALRQDLPDYMIPNDMVVLEAMPLTPNGKIDRRQLPAPESLGAVSSATYMAPENDLQADIVQIWREVLRVDKVGVKDNFFDLGGHSLLIVRVHQLLKQKLEKPIALTDLYRFPTIAALTEFLTGDQAHASLQQGRDRAARRRERMGLRRRGRK
ncbi:MAG: LLM class flavin-dependent oxidoreductase [Cellvibrionaceae bacterium]|nr:LLM class flavin-dependent oxidoreductase [Cellvibrionaceae bacterium]